MVRIVLYYVENEPNSTLQFTHKPLHVGKISIAKFNDSLTGTFRFDTLISVIYVN